MGRVTQSRGYFTTVTLAAANAPDFAVIVIAAVPGDAPTAVQPVVVRLTEATAGAEEEQRTRSVTEVPTVVAKRRIESPTVMVAADGDTASTINGDVRMLAGSESLQASALRLAARPPRIVAVDLARSDQRSRRPSSLLGIPLTRWRFRFPGQRKTLLRGFMII